MSRIGNVAMLQEWDCNCSALPLPSAAKVIIILTINLVISKKVYIFAISIYYNYETSY